MKYNWITALSVSLFVSLLVFFALYTRIAVSPDGLVHLGFAMYGIPNINLFGPATENFPIKYVQFYNTGYGYHYFLHAAYKLLDVLSSGSISESYWVSAPFMPPKDALPIAYANFLFIVRIVSVLLTCLQVYMLKKICDITQIEKIFPVALLWLSFTTMFPLLHANASRDVLVNCLSICFIYNVLSFHFSRKAVNVKYILLILAIAPFVQLSLCLFIVIVLSSYALFYFRASFNEMGREALQIITLKKGYIFPVLLVLIGLPGTVDLVNKITRYESIRPGCTKMFSVAECEENNENYKTYRTLKLSRANKERISLSEYAKVWYPGVFARIFGIMGHRSYSNPLYYILLCTLSALFLISVVLSIAYRKKDLLFVGFISLLYCVVIFYFVNRQVYLTIGVLNAGLQGRYIFPVYPLMLVFAHSCLCYLPRVGYYLYTLLSFNVLLYTYYIFWNSPQVKSIIMM